LLEVRSSALGWRLDAPVVLDVADFEAAVNAAEEARRSADVTAAHAQLEVAVALYRGALLPGFYDEWIVGERDRLAVLAERALDQLVDLLEAQRDYSRAFVHAQRLHVLSGDHAGARRVYQACVDVLQRELGVEPARATLDAYRVARREVAEPRPVGHAHPLRWPLIGREREWASLREFFQAGSSGTRLLLIIGEAGVGKTRLTEELVEWRSGHGDLPAVAACYRGGVISYAPVTAWLRTPGVEAARAGLPDLWLGEVGRIVPELLADRPDLTPRPITEDWQRQHLFEAQARALVAPGHPLILVLEDLHWCDHATFYFLGFFLRWRVHTPVVVCATARVEELGDHPDVGLLLAALRRDGTLREISPPARELAGLAATIGREFRFPCRGHTEEAAVSCLDELTQRTLVREHGDAICDFSHDKIRLAAYAQLSTARRRLQHACRRGARSAAAGPGLRQRCSGAAL
jgi:AAA ATPase domain/Bacterial transcriptional activator domain